MHLDIGVSWVILFIYFYFLLKFIHFMFIIILIKTILKNIQFYQECNLGSLLKPKLDYWGFGWESAGFWG